MQQELIPLLTPGTPLQFKGDNSDCLPGTKIGPIQVDLHSEGNELTASLKLIVERRAEFVLRPPRFSQAIIGRSNRC